MNADSRANAATGNRPDRWLLSLGMVLVAVLVGAAIQIKDGTYDPAAMILIGLALVIGIAAIAVVFADRREVPRLWILAILVMGMFVELIIALVDQRRSDSSMAGSIAIACMAVACVMPIPQLRLALVWLMLVAFLWMGAMHIAEHPHTGVDVLVFQKGGARELLKGRNPYAMRFPNVYGNNKSFYGPGVVDENNMLTIGFPYPPASLLMTVPSVALTDECRYSDLVALVISAGLMAFAVPGRLSALAAGLFMLSPRNLLVLEYSWTESLLLMTFSLTLFLAIRRRSVMPYVLGLFFATKQSSVLALPAMGLLVQAPGYWPKLSEMLLKAVAVAAVITLPFFLWNPHEFWHVVVQWQFVQPFRPDALSFMVWLRQNDLMPWLFTGPEHRPSMLVPFALVVGAALLAIWRCPRTPAGFAATVCMLNLVFFAFSKQAFCNYYFFAIGAACWAVASALPASRLTGKAGQTAR